MKFELTGKGFWWQSKTCANVFRQKTDKYTMINDDNMKPDRYTISFYHDLDNYLFVCFMKKMLLCVLCFPQQSF